MARFYQLIVSGTVSQQQLTNIFYVGRADLSDCVFDTAEMLSVAGQFELNIQSSNYYQLVPDDAVFDLIKVRLIDEKRKVHGFFDVDNQINITGGSTTAFDGHGPCAIIAYTLEPIETAQTFRIPRRSYNAYGPIPGAIIADNGSLTLSSRAALGTATNNLIANITSPNSGLVYEHIRVGVANKDDIGAAGRIVEVDVAPFSSFRRSRMPTVRGG